MVDTRYRPATGSDTETLARLRTEIFERTGHGRAVTDADVTHEFTVYGPPESVLVAETPQGLVSWAACPENPTGARRFLAGGVHPDHRDAGVGRHLLAWQLNRLGPGDQPTVPTVSTDLPTQALARRFGLVPRRQFLLMSRRTDVPATPAPTDLAVAAYRPDDDRRLWIAHQEAFAGHFGFEPTPLADWAERSPKDPRFRADLSFAAWDGDELVGFALTYRAAVSSSPHAPVVIQQVGTRTAWRKRGAAGALLGAIVDAARAAGVPELQLNVDAQNDTGAITVYERSGFTESFRRIHYGWADGRGSDR
jgi:mycothiol synthase